LSVFLDNGVFGADSYLDYLKSPPSLVLDSNTLTFNSNHKDFFKKRLKIKVNKKEKEVFLYTVSRWQRKNVLSFDPRLTVTFELNKYKIKEAINYNFYWLDPDGKTTEINVSTHSKAFHSGPIYPFRQGNDWFYVDSNLNTIGDKSFDFVYPFYFNYAVVKIKDKYALINKAFEPLTQAIFDTINYQNYDTLKSPVFSVIKDGNYFHIDTNGQVFSKERPILRCGGTGGMQFFNTYKLDGKFGLEIREEKGYKKLPAIYDSITTVADFLALVQISDKYGLVDSRGKELLPLSMMKLGLVLLEIDTTIHTE